MPESYDAIRNLLDTVAVLRGKSPAPVLSLGGTPQVPSENRSGATTDQQIVRLWLDAKRSAHTRRSYARDMALFNEFLAALPTSGAAPRPYQLSEVTVAHIEAFYRAMATARVPPRTIARRLSAVKSLLTFAQQTGYLHFNVGTVVKLPAFAHDVAARILSESEVHACIYAAPEGRTRTLIRFMYYTGARVSEAVAVRWEHLTHRDDRFIVCLFGKGGKTRHVPVPLSLRSQLEELRKNNISGYVFETRGGHRLSEKDAWRFVEQAARAAGITRRVSPHFLRHSHASHALRRGADIHVVQKTLGHSNIRTTADYLHLERGESSAMYLDTEPLDTE